MDHLLKGGGNLVSDDYQPYIALRDEAMKTCSDALGYAEYYRTVAARTRRRGATLTLVGAAASLTVAGLVFVVHSSWVLIPFMVLSMICLVVGQQMNSSVGLLCVAASVGEDACADMRALCTRIDLHDVMSLKTEYAAFYSLRQRLHSMSSLAHAHIIDEKLLQRCRDSAELLHGCRTANTERTAT